jgi:hypothetical protein
MSHRERGFQPHPVPVHGEGLSPDGRGWVFDPDDRVELNHGEVLEVAAIGG